ncbi:MAG TPA: hypothetical protein VFQ65_23190 [Kofleriaceae bacterium]|nr:hypothetical protein [Kofleriaceae bacterium]
MRLGEMLVRDGRLTETQLKQALTAQAKDGGRLGTVLFEHGLVDLEALTVYLGLELGIPIATGAMLERAKRAAVRLLQPATAFKFKVVPLVVQDRQLIAAVEDPHDFATLEALTHQTGYRVLPRVAPEVRIYYYIERYYGVARPARFVKFGESPRGDENAADPALPAPPLPGLPPAAAAPVSAPGPKPRLRSTKMAQLFDDSESLELDAEDLLETLDADDAAPAERATTVRPHRSTNPPIVAEVDAAPRHALAADDALAALATVTDRDAMIDALLGYAAGAFQGAVLFTVRDQLAFGWKAVGDLPGRAHVEHLLIPLDVPSIIQTAVAAESGVFSGEVAPSTVNTYLHKVLGIAEPKSATAGVITIGKRVVNVLYGYGKELSADEIDELRQVCAVAAEAYARLIAVRKKK